MKSKLTLTALFIFAIFVCVFVYQKNKVSAPIEKSEKVIYQKKEKVEITKRTDGKWVEDYGTYELIRDSLATSSPTVYHNKEFGFSVVDPCEEGVCFGNQTLNSLDLHDGERIIIGGILVSFFNSEGSLVNTFPDVADFVTKIKHGSFKKIKFPQSEAFVVTNNDDIPVLFGTKNSFFVSDYIFDIGNNNYISISVEVEWNKKDNNELKSRVLRSALPTISSFTILNN